MKTSFLMLAAVALVAAFVHFADIPGRAEAAVPSSSAEQAIADELLAAPKFKTHLTWDGGATGISQVALIGTNVTIQFEPVTGVALPNGSAFCFKTCTTSTCVPDCTKDFVLNQPVVTYQSPDGGPGGGTGYTIVGAPRALDPIWMGADSYVVVSSLDAGDPNINLFTVPIRP